MDDIFLPDEDEGDGVEFERQEIEAQPEKSGHPSGVNPSDYIRISFGRFVTLVAEHSFVEVVEKNKDQDVIISTNLLTDLANARRLSAHPRGTLVALAGVVGGVLLGYFLFAI